MAPILEKFKASAVVVAVVLLILVLGQTQAAPSLPLPASYHFKYDNNDGTAGAAAKRGSGGDKGHPPAAATDWNLNGDMHHVDVAVETLEQLKNPSLLNTEQELKEDTDKWHLKEVETGPVTSTTPKVDELAEELRKLEGNESATEQQRHHLLHQDGGQLEQDDRASYFNERLPEEESVVAEPTEEQIQKEQRKVDEEIQGEINKDQQETMEPQHHHSSTGQEHFYPYSPQHVTTEKPLKLPPSPPPQPGQKQQVAKEGEDSRVNVSLPMPMTTEDVPPLNQQEEQLELLKETPQQNEDVFNLFTKNGHRRSAGRLPTMSVSGLKEQLLQPHQIKESRGGQYSAHDLAQYVFWTGDEAGVAQAIEDLIEKGLMSRENAIKFLRDIRVGIDSLQNAYAAEDSSISKLAAFSEEKVKAKPWQFPVIKPAAVTAQFDTIPTAFELDSALKPHKDQQQAAANTVLKSLDNMPALLKLNEMILSRGDGENNEVALNLNGDDLNGRLRLADFLYAEYTMEEVIYQLAKVMFNEALTKGSPSAQEALQKFISFIDVEAAQGRISPGLQKKVIDVLMTALSDTLTEHPELLVMAKAYLGSHLGGN